MSKCIIIPAFNEYENINILLKEIYKNDFKDLIIIIIDDSDESFEKYIQKQEDSIVYLFRGKKLGRGSAVLYGIEYALNTFKNIDLFIEMDADMSHNPNELKKNLACFNEKNLDLLISSRYKKESKIINWPLKRKILSFLSNRLSKLILNIPITDYTNGYRIYSNKAAKFVVKNCGKIGDGYIVLSEILIQLYYNKYKIGEIETIFANRVRGTSNVTISEIFLSLIGLFKIWRIKLKLNRF
ncbi:glycosyltransferase [Candidatus Pelagibacter sp.]|uniref:glycosyltransferase n=1 Tax=Candidatus Pelagibacter sp. TaxID=2024849 RepID=UPI003F86F3CE